MWHIWHGSWWMVQAQYDWWLSLGIHIDLKTRVHSRYFVCYGPYIDVHFGPFIFSLGRNCHLAVEGIQAGRGGVS